MDTCKELAAAVYALLGEVYQMQGMFDDDDGCIQRAIDDAEKALENYRRDKP